MALSFSFKSLACELQRAAVLRHCTYDLIGCASRDFCRDLQRDPDGRTHQSGEMRNNLFRDTTGVAAYSGRIEGDAAMKAFGAMPLRLIRTRRRFWMRSWTRGLLSTGCRVSWWPGLQIQLLPCDLGADEQSRGAVRRKACQLPVAEAAISSGFFVEVIRVGVAILFPCQQAETVANG